MAKQRVQRRQQRNGRLKDQQVLRGRNLTQARKYILEVQNKHGYLFLARVTCRTHGWWQQVATGKGRAKPLVSDYDAIKTVALVVREFHKMDSEIIEAMIRLHEAQANVITEYSAASALFVKRSKQATRNGKR